MYQLIFALLLIAYFLAKLFLQKKQSRISLNEFYFWLVFWLGALLLVFGLKQLDAFVKQLGFTASGIQVLLYFGVAVLFYLIFRLRLKQEKLEESITKLVEALALSGKDKPRS